MDFRLSRIEVLCKSIMLLMHVHDEVIKWKNFPRYWPFVRGIHLSPVNSPHKGQWHGALMFSLICVWRNGWVNNRKAGDLRCYHAHYDVIVMSDMNVIQRIDVIIFTKKKCGRQITYFSNPIPFVFFPVISKTILSNHQQSHKIALAPDDFMVNMLILVHNFFVVHVAQIGTYMSMQFYP